MLQKIDTSTRLKEKLSHLQSRMSKHYAQLKRSNEGLWRLVAETYLCWSQASQEPGFLEKLYKEKSIEFRQSTDGQPNFTPLLRYLMDPPGKLDAAQRVTLSSWNRALQAVHEHYQKNDKDFRSNAEGKILDFIRSKGGVDGLVSDVPKERKKSRPKGGSKGGGKAGGKNEAKIRKERIGLALDRLKNRPPIGEVVMKDATRPCVAGPDGLLVIVARREEDGRLSVIDTTADPEPIQSAAESCAAQDPPQGASPVAVVAAVIGTQTLPAQALPPEGRTKRSQKNAEGNEAREMAA